MMEPLEVWAVYDHPRDYPEEFVARLWHGQEPSNHVILARTLDELRVKIQQAHPSAVRIPRFAEDDPTIIEAWL